MNSVTVFQHAFERGLQERSVKGIIFSDKKVHQKTSLGLQSMVLIFGKLGSLPLIVLNLIHCIGRQEDHDARTRRLLILQK